MGLDAEMEVINEIIKETKKRVPYFELSIIVVSYKMAGHKHVKKMIDTIQVARQKYPDLIAGFDLVNEEDFTDQISEFMPQILAAQKDESSLTHGMHTFMHAGETHNPLVKNLHDAMLLNSKRIGHGF